MLKRVKFRKRLISYRRLTVTTVRLVYAEQCALHNIVHIYMLIAYIIIIIIIIILLQEIFLIF
jgi:hypothetical protein